MMRWFILVLLLSVMLPITQAQQNLNLDETFVAEDLGITLYYPDEAEVSYNPGFNIMQVSVLGGELEFDVYAEPSLALLGYDGATTVDDLVELFLADISDVQRSTARSINGQRVTITRFADSLGEQLLMVMPFDESFIVFRTRVWANIGQQSALLQMITNIESSDGTSISPTTESDDSARVYVSDEGNYSIAVPSDLTIEEDDSSPPNLTLSNDDIELFVFGPFEINNRTSDPLERSKAVLTDQIEFLEWELVRVLDQTIDGKTVVYARYTVGTFDGILAMVALPNDQYIFIDTISWFDNSSSVNQIVDIARSIESTDSTPTTTDSRDNVIDIDRPHQEVIKQLEDLGIVGLGSEFIFEENRAYFAGQGGFITPLARFSPQTHFVMAANLTFTAGRRSPSPTEIESCALMARAEFDNQGITRDYVEVGFDSYGDLYYVDLENGNLITLEDLGDVELGETYHVMMIAREDTLTVFLDGVQVSEPLPYTQDSGIFGISLLGYGASAECVGEDIWVYSVAPDIDGECGAIASGTINQRTGPGTNFDIAGQLGADAITPVIGFEIGTDGFLWWQLEDASWVREDIVRVVGNCLDVPRGDQSGTDAGI